MAEERLFRDKTERMLVEMLATPVKERPMKQSVITEKWAPNPASPFARRGRRRKKKSDLPRPAVAYKRMNVKIRKKGVNWRQLETLVEKHPGQKSKWYAEILGCTDGYVRATMQRRGWSAER